MLVFWEFFLQLPPGNLPIEFLATQRQDGAAPIEWVAAAGFESDDNLPIEWVATEGQSASVSTEWVSALAESGGLPAEWSASAKSDGTVPVEWLQAVVENIGAPAEFLATQQGGGGSPIEWIATQIDAATLPAEWASGFSVPPASSITVGASPFTYTNNDQFSETVYIFSGTVSAIALARGAFTQTVAAATGISVEMAPGDAVTVTYSVLPSMAKYPTSK